MEGKKVIGKSKKQEQFQIFIENHVATYNIGYIEAIAEYMENKDLEAHQVKKLISSTLEEKIMIEASKNNLLVPEAKISYAELPL